MIYPLKFVPVFQERIWGGKNLYQTLGRPVPGELRTHSVGESWEFADLAPGSVQSDSRGANPDGSLSSRLANGPWTGRTIGQVLHECASQLVGRMRLGAGGHVPLLVKFLDARADLSIQVHPDETYCRNHPGTHVKSEAWYVLDAEPGARIFKGLKPGVNKEALRRAVEQGQVETVLNSVSVRAGDFHYLPSGTVHALGAGMLVAEVQTPSDTTFRLFDWHRLGPGGKPRALHIEAALEAIDYAAPSPDAAVRVQQICPQGGSADTLVKCAHFEISRIHWSGGVQTLESGRAGVWIIVAGQGLIQARGIGPTAFTRGDVVFLPAGLEDARVCAVSDCVRLEVKLPEAA